MNEATISQDELNNLLNSAKMQKNAEPAACHVFSSTELRNKFFKDEEHLKKILSEQKITVSQSEVDALLKPHASR